MSDLSLQSRIEFALRDAGFSNREAAELAKRAAAVPDRERVARAIANTYWSWADDKAWVRYLPQADAAIAAMEGKNDHA